MLEHYSEKQWSKDKAGTTCPERESPRKAHLWEANLIKSQ
jgi:hypothetical protein